MLGDPDGVFVPLTVVLELVWVLRAFYGFGAADIGRVLRHLAALPRVRVEDCDAVLEASDMAEAGLDFADALHLASPHYS